MASKPLDRLHVGDYACIEWPGNRLVRVAVLAVSCTMITTTGGKRWNRKTGMPVPRRLYQGQRLTTKEASDA